MKVSSFLLKVLPTLLLSSAALAAPAAAKPNAEMQKILNELNSEGGKPIQTLTPQEARLQPSPLDAMRAIVKKENKVLKDYVVDVKDIEIQSADPTTTLPARVYLPKGKAERPVVVYFHGGGFVIATNDTYDLTPRSLAGMTGAIFVSVEYRKAPENRFPTAVDDAYAAYKWVLAHAATLEGDAKHVAVAGESAGANLALNVAVLARNEGIQAPAAELLVYPVAGNNVDTDSYKQYADAKPLNRPMMEWFLHQYYRTPSDAKDPRNNLLEADLHKLNPVTLIAAEIDPLQSEGKALADKLTSSGVRVDYKKYDGVTHEFFGMAPLLKEARDAQELAAKDLRAALKAK